MSDITGAISGFRGIGAGVYPNKAIDFAAPTIQVTRQNKPVNVTFDVSGSVDDTWINVPLATITLAAGQHYIGYQLLTLADGGVSFIGVAFRIIDNLNNVVEGSRSVTRGIFDQGETGYSNVEAHCLVTPSDSRTYRLQIARTAGATAAATIEGATPTVTLTGASNASAFWSETYAVV
jgi:hypothetical protein